MEHCSGANSRQQRTYEAGYSMCNPVVHPACAPNTGSLQRHDGVATKNQLAHCITRLNTRQNTCVTRATNRQRTPFKRGCNSYPSESRRRQRTPGLIRRVTGRIAHPARIHTVCRRHVLRTRQLMRHMTTPHRGVGHAAQLRRSQKPG